MVNIVIFGSSGHARVVIDMVEGTGEYEIVGLLDKFRLTGTKLHGYTVLGEETELPKLRATHAIKGGIIAIGDNYIRHKVADRVVSVEPGFPFFSVFHANATIAKDAVIGAGTVIMAGAIVNPGCSVGRCCILNTNASLDHDSTMGDFSSLAPKVATGGNVHIGAFSAIGIGAQIIHSLQIGEHTVIGAGATVTRNIDPYKVAYGTPAVVVRERSPGDKYL